jgi:hypothetical protein
VSPQWSLTPIQRERRALHEEITGQDLRYEEIEERAEEIIRNRA